MEKGRRKIKLCLLAIVLAAIVIGVVYYYGESGNKISSEGTLIRGEQVENYGC